MIVPDYWAEARKQYKNEKRQVTVRRFGWSETSPTEAQAMAELRAEEALQRAISGEKVRRRELKVPYNGGQGLPIREEVLKRHEDVVITRNSYGAKCLNTPNVLVADVDFPVKSAWHARMQIALWNFMGLATVYSYTQSWWLAAGLAGVTVLCSVFIYLLHRRSAANLAERSEQRSRQRLESFLDRNSDWNVRVYRTPAGLRVIATHQKFAPSDFITQEFFRVMETDPIYVRMCLNQQCFRARLTAKPWRVGLKHHLKPRPGVWPVKPESLTQRNAWLEEYDRISANFAACRFLESIGSGKTHYQIKQIVDLHDRECRAGDETAPMA